jgi:hypothetical protein
VLGIFARDSMDLASIWGTVDAKNTLGFAFRMYRNYDGNGAGFGDTSVRATSGGPSKLSGFAAARGSDGALTVMVINKLTTELTTTVNLARFRPAGRAQVYRFSGSPLGAIERRPDLRLGVAGTTTTFPGRSVTLLVVPRR